MLQPVCTRESWLLYPFASRAQAQDQQKSHCRLLAGKGGHGFHKESHWLESSQQFSISTKKRNEPATVCPSGTNCRASQADLARTPFLPLLPQTGITRDSRHKRSASGAQRAHYRHKRKFELGRQAAMTRLGQKRIHQVRVRGGNIKHRALRLETGNYAWGSEHVTRKTRLIGVVYNASNNELVRTNTLVKGSIIQIDAAPFRQWYEAHYHQPVSKKGKVRTF